MDELVAYLRSGDPEHVIVGENGCNLLILGDGSKRRTSIRALALVIGCNNPIRAETICDLRNKYRANRVFRQLFSTGKHMAELVGIPFVMIAYQHCFVENITDEVMNSMKFMVKNVSPNNEPVIYTSNECAAFVHWLLRIRYTDTGTSKAKNKRVADAFHVWSRAKLSAVVVKQDFDAIYCRDGRYAMIEVKRSPAKSLEEWTPYAADRRNYDIQNRFSKYINAPFYTFHHTGGPCEAETKIGCYRVSNVDTGRSNRWIEYKKELIEAGTILEMLHRESSR